MWPKVNFRWLENSLLTPQYEAKRGCPTIRTTWKPEILWHYPKQASCLVTKLKYPKGPVRNQKYLSRVEMTEQQDKVSETILLDKIGTLVNQKQKIQKELNSSWNLARSLSSTQQYSKELYL